MTAVFDCGDFYFFGNYQKYQVEEVLADELGLVIIATEITWEEYERREDYETNNHQANHLPDSLL